ncbi:YojF family protein [Lentibacillus juripiscarius]|uniref:YojF family protein n=1 Tax=Lentibacillus juripiscarius TaxID=257446 RepID=A0ABW5V6C4_9BACI
MEPIEIEKVQHLLESFINKDVYIHLETTNGAYASHFNDKAYNVGAYVRNAQVNFSQAKIVGDGKTFRAGLKLEMGWVYAEGLTEWTLHQDRQLLLAGHDREGRLMVALHISETPLGQ